MTVNEDNHEAQRRTPAGRTEAKRQLTRCIIWAVLIIVALPFLCLFIKIVASGIEQLPWFRENLDRLVVTENLYSHQGIKLQVHVPSGMDDVWKPRPRVEWPWERDYYRIPFRVIEGDKAGDITLLVEYEFRPREEWGLTIKSHDGYWFHMSPYFPDEPDLTDEEWDELVKKSQLVVADG